MEYEREKAVRSFPLLFAIVIALCLLPASVNAGVSPDDGRAIGDAINGTYAYIGETNLDFVDTAGNLIPAGYLVSDWEDSNINIPFPNSGSVFDSKKEAYRLLSGWYKVTDILGEEKARVYFASEDDFDVKTLVREVEDFGWVTRSLDITFEATTSLEQIKGDLPTNYIHYKLLDPDGFRIYVINGVSLSNIDVSGDGDDHITVNTAGLDLGVYTLSIVTDPDTNNGLDVESNETSFEVRSEGITIDAEPTETVTKYIKFEVATTPDTPVILNVTWGLPANVMFLNKFDEEVGSSIVGTSNDVEPYGAFDRKAYFLATGAYEITATELLANTTDSIFVEIVPYEAELNVDKDPPIYHIGENVEITCSADIAVKMGSLTLKINDEIVASGESVDGFDYTWKTENLAPDSYKIALWVLPFSDPFQDPPDASLSIVLIRGGLIVTPSAPFVALGDKFTIEGIVPGRDRVDILTIAPDGGGGRGLDPGDIFDDTNGKLDAPGLTYETTGVDTDGEFETENIAVGEDVDTGTYLIAALNYGRDGVWGKSLNDNLLEVLSNDYASPLGAKLTDQLLAILKDRTINAAGTDDLLGIATISVEKGFVTLDELEDVPLGKKIEITGTTNRQVDTPIIVTVEGLEETTPKLKPRIAKVKEDDKTFYNTFSISFDTKSTNIGTYEVTADDGDGHTASTTVTILPAEEFSVTVSTTPTPKTEDQEPETGEEAEKPPAKTTTPTPTPTEEPAEQPGFGMPLTIAGLLLTVVVLLRRRTTKR